MALWFLTLGLGAIYVQFPPIWDVHGMMLSVLPATLGLLRHGEVGWALFALVVNAQFLIVGVTVLIAEAWALANLIWLPARTFLPGLLGPRGRKWPLAPPRVWGRPAASWRDHKSRTALWFVAWLIVAGFLVVGFLGTAVAEVAH